VVRAQVLAAQDIDARPQRLVAAAAGRHGRVLVARLRGEGDHLRRDQIRTCVIWPPARVASGPEDTGARARQSAPLCILAATHSFVVVAAYCIAIRHNAG
jgi:hypothetical protein